MQNLFLTLTLNRVKCFSTLNTSRVNELKYFSHSTKYEKLFCKTNTKFIKHKTFKLQDCIFISFRTKFSRTKMICNK